MSRWGEPLRRQRIASRRTAALSSALASVCRSGRDRVDLARARRARAAPARAAPSRGRPGSRPRARAAGARSSGGSGTARSRGRRRPARGSRPSAPPARARRPSRARRSASSRSLPCFASSSARAAASASVTPTASDRSAGPTYSADGRNSRPVRFCSRMCADQPATREHANIAGASGGRDLGDVEHDRRVVLDVRRQHALGVPLLQRLERDLLELLGHLDVRRAELLRRPLQDPRARVLGAVDAVAEAHDPLAAARAASRRTAPASPSRRDLVEHRHHVRGRAAVQRPGERADGRRERGPAVGAGRGDDPGGERRGVEPVLGRADPVGVDRLRVPRVGLAAPAQQELLGRRLALRDHVVRHRLRVAVGDRAPSGPRSPSSAPRAGRGPRAPARPRSRSACRASTRPRGARSRPAGPTARSRSGAAGSYGSGSGIAELMSSSTSRPQTFS